MDLFVFEKTKEFYLYNKNSYFHRTHHILLCYYFLYYLYILSYFHNDGICDNELCYRCGNIEQCKNERKQRCF